MLVVGLKRFLVQTNFTLTFSTTCSFNYGSAQIRQPEIKIYKRSVRSQRARNSILEHANFATIAMESKHWTIRDDEENLIHQDLLGRTCLAGVGMVKFIK